MIQNEEADPASSEPSCIPVHLLKYTGQHPVRVHSNPADDFFNGLSRNETWKLICPCI
jgi:hypothetical protein